MRNLYLTIPRCISIFKWCYLIYASASIAHAQHGAKIQARQAIEQSYKAEQKATQNKDLSLSNFLPSWYAVLPNGQKFTYEMLKKILSTTYPLQDYVSSNDQILSFIVTKEGATAKIKGHSVQGLSKGNKHLIIVTDANSIDKWITIKGHWMHKQTEILKVNVTYNGKPVLGQ